MSACSSTGLPLGRTRSILRTCPVWDFPRRHDDHVTAALDDRIKRALIAGYVTEMSGTVLPIRHCSCNYIPSSRVRGFSDVAGLVAPRFLIVQSGGGMDFPHRIVRAAYKKIEAVYAVCGEPGNVKLHEHEGFLRSGRLRSRFPRVRREMV